MENIFPTADSAQKPLPVLVVDDDDLFLKYCNRVLDDRSFAVDMVEDGLEALEKVLQRDYEVILLDVAMPHMDGIACLKRLQERGCDAVIIMVTGGRCADGCRSDEVGGRGLYRKTF